MCTIYQSISEYLRSIMNKQVAYIQNCVAPHTVSEIVICKNLDLVQDKKNFLVLDVGCGPGNVTSSKVLPMLPTTTNKLIGIDICHDNIEYARKFYQNDARLLYRQMDILDDTIPNDFMNTFDLVFSIYCFHFVGDHRKAFNNVYKLLNFQGKILITFIKNYLVLDVYRSLYKNKQWKGFMSNFNRSVHPPTTKKYLKELLEEIGFKKIEFQNLEKPVVRTEASTKNFLSALNVFPVPEHLHNDFVQAQVNYLEENNFVSIGDNGEKEFNLSYDVLTIRAYK